MVTRVFAYLVIMLFSAVATGQQGVDQEPSVGELINNAREAERWVQRVDGLILKLEGEWTRTQESIARRTAEYRRRYPQIKATAENFGDLRPRTPESLTIAFDDQRLFYESHWIGNRYERQFWDGERSIQVSGPDEVVHDGYWFGGQPRSSQNMWNGMFVDLSWQRTTSQSYWWHSADPSLAEYERQIDATAVITGTTDFHGVECFIIDMRGGFTRWYVGVDDHLLHGFLQRVQGPKADPLGAIDRIGRRRDLEFEDFADYAQWKAILEIDEQIAVDAEYQAELITDSRPMAEHYLLDYREVAPGCVFPARQGYRLFGDTPGDDGRYPVETERELRLVEARNCESLPEEWFQIDLLRGVMVFDTRFGVGIEYRYDPDRTLERVEAMVAERREQIGERQQEIAARDELIGEQAFEFPEDSQWLNSRALTREDLRGKIVILDFWAIWCGPCRGDLPKLAELHRELRENDLIAVIGVHTPGSRREDIREVLDLYDMEYPICIDVPVRDDRNAIGLLSADYRVRGIPHLVLIDEEGRVVAHGESRQILPHARMLAMRLKSTRSRR